MSFGLPSLKVKPEYGSNIKPQEGPFGVPNPLVAGLSGTKSKLGVSHPLEVSERNGDNCLKGSWWKNAYRNLVCHAPSELLGIWQESGLGTFATYYLNQEKMDMAMLRNVQGLHAPLKLTMERKFASKIGHLPFLPRSNFQHDVLTGKYLDIGFEDILNTPEHREVAGQPHAVVERSLGLL